MRILALVLVFIGLVDSTYLVAEHYSEATPPCRVGFSLVDCGAVLRSKYAVIAGVPMAVLGLVHYAFLRGLILYGLQKKSLVARSLAVIESLGGALFSVYLVYLQLFVLHAICIYCMLSAVVSFILCATVFQLFAAERTYLVRTLIAWFYKHVSKPLFFMFDPEFVHQRVVTLGEVSMQVPGVAALTRWILAAPDKTLGKTLMGIHFASPIGLAAGFDYEARLSQSLAPLGFGFQTVGTMTNEPCEGNPTPRLGRLPLSRSLMVNKGFRNPGINAVIAKLKGKQFSIPLGISIGDAKGRIDQIITAFKKCERAKLNHSYYELNISCPNLHGALSLYEPKNLQPLLERIDALKLKRPVWVKMPIDLTDQQTLALLRTIAKHSPKAVIFGNLQKNRKSSAFVKAELKRFPVGNFSGKPTFARSNELIALAHKHFGKRFVVVGCGGVFDAKDARAKLKAGADLIQMITGMIFQGPQVVSQINAELAK